ncbi:MAG: hypothetical protein ABEJ46_03470 [Gemmatimonadota bacterium]
MMIRSRIRRPLAAATCALFLGLTGCYAYTPVEGSPPDAGSEVRLRLNDAGADSVAEQTFLSRPDVVEGELVERRTSGVRVVISRPARRDFVAGGRRTDTVSVPLAGIESTERKSMEVGKTAALVGGAGLGLGLAGVALMSAGGGGGGAPGGNDGQNLGISIPIAIP